LKLAKTTSVVSTIQVLKTKIKPKLKSVLVVVKTKTKQNPYSIKAKASHIKCIVKEKPFAIKKKTNCFRVDSPAVTTHTNGSSVQSERPDAINQHLLFTCACTLITITAHIRVTTYKQ